MSAADLGLVLDSSCCCALLETSFFFILFFLVEATGLALDGLTFSSVIIVELCFLCCCCCYCCDTVRIAGSKTTIYSRFALLLLRSFKWYDLIHDFWLWTFSVVEKKKIHCCCFDVHQTDAKWNLIDSIRFEIRRLTIESIWKIQKPQFWWSSLFGIPIENLRCFFGNNTVENERLTETNPDGKRCLLQTLEEYGSLRSRSLLL